MSLERWYVRGTVDFSLFLVNNEQERYDETSIQTWLNNLFDEGMTREVFLEEIVAGDYSTQATLDNHSVKQFLLYVLMWLQGF